MLTRLIPSPALRKWIRIGLVTVAAVVGIAIAGLAAFIATRDYAAIERAFVARIERGTGASLAFKTSRRVLWPKPKLLLEAVSLEDRARGVSLKAPGAVIRFALADLIDGAIDNPSITLEAPEIQFSMGSLASEFRSPRAVTQWLDGAIGALDAQTAFGALNLAVLQAKLVLIGAGPSGETLDLTPIDAGLSYSGRGGRIDVRARRSTTVRPLELAVSLPTHSALAGGKGQGASVQISGYDSRLAFAGTLRRDPDLLLAGRLETTLGLAAEAMLFDLPLKKREATADPIQLNAALTLDPRGIGLEALRVSRSSRQLGGIAALREVNQRWAVSATLAGDLVDGSAAQAALQRLRGPNGEWSKAALSINPLPGIDLDIRLSTQEFKLGNVILGNVALAIFTRPGRAELAIIDGRFGDGSIKARVSVADAPDGQQDLKLQASADKLDGGRFLERAVGLNRLLGTTSFVVQAESRGTSIAALAGNLAGAGVVEIRDGTLVGIDLARLLPRGTDARADAALLFALAGKTAFETMKIDFGIRNGRIEPLGSSFVSARVLASIEGMIDLAARRHQAAIVLRRRSDEPGLPSEFYAFRLDGPLFTPSVKPDLSLLANRS